jgi:UDP-GlcNAc:undecaprenyl-phosphate GlcNAc-1-phosphate transferase
VSILHYLALVSVAAIVTLVITPLVRRVSEHFGLVDTPGGRKVHQTPISRVGGVAIFSGMIAALAFQVFGEARLGWHQVLLHRAEGDPRLLLVLGGVTLMFVVGLIDDLVNLTPGAKLLGQIAAAGVVVASGLRIDYVGNPVQGGLVMLGLLSIPVTIIYLVGFANVINLIDGLDGLAAGVSGIAAMSLLALAAPANRFDAAALAAALIGACLGFLRYNFHPASIFMGDSGAMFLGFSLATISLLGVMKTTAAIALAVPLIILGVPIFDTASAILRRLRHNRPIQEADKGHIHHRLLGRGFDQRQTVLIIYAWSAALAVGGYAVRYSPGYMRFAALMALLAVTAFMAYWLGLFESVHRQDEDDA